MNYNSSFTVDTKKVKANLDTVFNNISSKTKIIPMLKANAYGHGLVSIAKLFEYDDRITFLGVAQVIEAIALKEADISKRIILFCGITDEQIETVVDHGFEPIIHNMESFRAFETYLKSQKIKKYPIHLKINTGLNRLGFRPNEELALFVSAYKKTNSFEIVSTYSHFIEGAKIDSKITHQQNKKFLNAINQLNAANIDYGFKHICDSGAYEWYNQAHYDAVRIGRALYMDNPYKAERARYKDVGSWTASIISKRTLQKSETLGYGANIVTEESLEVGIINVGYGDGLMMLTPDVKAPLLVNDQQTTILSIAMDQSYIDLTNIDANIGDPVTLYGFTKTGAYLSSNEIAKLIDDEGCTLTTLLSNRVLRIYK